jgi:hypothetical protein
VGRRRARVRGAHEDARQFGTLVSFIHNDNFKKLNLSTKSGGVSLRELLIVLWIRE